jgi:hypothetical protein
VAAAAAAGQPVARRTHAPARHRSSLPDRTPATTPARAARFGGVPSSTVPSLCLVRPVAPARRVRRTRLRSAIARRMPIAPACPMARAFWGWAGRRLVTAPMDACATATAVRARSAYAATPSANASERPARRDLRARRGATASTRRTTRAVRASRSGARRHPTSASRTRIAQRSMAAPAP